jgi:hypothetical protein
MPIKSSIIKPIARLWTAKLKRKAENPLKNQEAVLQHLLKHGKNTEIGKNYQLGNVASYAEFQQAVPLGDYENLAPYISQILEGKQNVLWPGKPIYFAKTSGTTSGTKLIPITKHSIPYHVGSARNAVFSYIAETGDASAFDGGMIFLSGSPILEKTGGILTGRLSGIVNHHIPPYLKNNQLPSWTTNCIDDWEEKLNAIVRETIHRDMRLIGGIPSWVQMYFDRLIKVSGKETVKEVFPNLSLYVYGGVNYAPYKQSMEKSLGSAVKTIETYPASEGFIAYQDSQEQEGLLLQTDAGIFFEFIRVNDLNSPNPPRIALESVQLNQNYALILHTNAGLWGYLIGDTVRFVSLKPFRIVVTGRIKHFISAFGEHVIAEEVEGAMKDALLALPNLSVVEFHVAPYMPNNNTALPAHHWYVEFAEETESTNELSRLLEENLQKRNSYYKDLVQGKIIAPLSVLPLKPGTFHAYMKSQGKLGGQNKIPRLANTSDMARDLYQIHLSR